MQSDEKYKNTVLATSYMAAVNKTEIDLSVDYIKNILHQNSSFTIVDIYEVPNELRSREDSLSEVIVKLQYLPLMVDMEDDEEGDNNDEEDNLDILSFSISIIPTKNIKEFVQSVFATKESDENIYKDALNVQTCVLVSTEFVNIYILDYQRQLKLLRLIANESLIFIDMSSFSVRTGSWLEYISTFDLPPSLDYLFSIHAIYEDEKEPCEYWFHTHGLTRTGIPEIEIFNVSNGGANYGTLISTIAKQFIEFGLPEKGCVFEPAYDVSVTWEHFDEAVSSLSKGMLGTEKEEGDEDHHNNSVVIVGIKDDKKVGLDFFENILADNPVFSLSEFETKIMRDAAHESIKYFLYFFNKYRDDENCNFIVKLGYGENSDDSEVEHLWFMLYDFDEEMYTFTATLLNEPYYDLGMHEGDTGEHSFEKLTDWKIMKDDIYYDSSNIYLLFENSED